MSLEDLKRSQRSRLHELKSDMFLSTPKFSTFPDNREFKIKEITRSSVGTVNRIYESGIKDLMLQLTQLLDEMPREFNQNLGVENASTESRPPFWIVKWANNRNKFGFGYQLNDGSIGVIFEDKTSLLMLANEMNMRYIDVSGNKTYMTYKNYPERLEARMKLFLFFKHLLSKNWTIQVVDDQMKGVVKGRTAVPFLHTWFKTAEAFFFHLTNGTVQVNFKEDRILLCPRSETVTYFGKTSHTYEFSTISELGCSKILADRLRYAEEHLEIFLTD